MSSFLVILFMLATPAAWAQNNQAPLQTIQIQSVSSITNWEPSQIHEVHLQVALPPHFHAYTDQFKVIDLEPAGFKASQIQVKPEIEFFDKFTKKVRKGFTSVGNITIVVEGSEQIPAGLSKVTFNLRHQICSESVCYLPKNILVEVPVGVRTQFNAAAPVETNEKSLFSFSFFDNLKYSLESNIFLAFLLVFFAGVLTSFTPCIFPMLPITISILGYHANHGNRFHNFSRAVAYVFGIAITYSLLGVAAALTGSLFGSALTNKFVVFALCLLFILMAFSMWGAFEIQVPAFIRNRFGSGKSHGLGGAFVMGLVAGVVASPCVGPVLVSILSFVSTTRNVFLGFGLLFTFAMGLGMIFIVIGLFSHALHLLPKSGAWMNLVKFILGAGMWFAALYYSQFLISHRWWIALIAASFVALSIWKGAFNFGSKNYLKQSLMLTLFIFSTTVLLLSFVRPQYLSPAFQQVGVEGASNRSGQQQVVWIPYSDTALQSAVSEQKPVLLDFYADWCGACHELEEKTYSNPEFLELSENFKLIKLDATEDTPEIQTILKKYQVQGLPTVQFINKTGSPIKNLTFTQFLEWNELKPKMQEALK
ncbi:MAG: thioredoxin family protein [Bdellovibrionaceae bacterium]|nr:thioredoxin family protein [Bdellovibrio sp.]